jgi:hypothetical protein
MELSEELYNQAEILLSAINRFDKAALETFALTFAIPFFKHFCRMTFLDSRADSGRDAGRM